MNVQMKSSFNYPHLHLSSSSSFLADYPLRATWRQAQRFALTTIVHYLDLVLGPAMSPRSSQIETSRVLGVFSQIPKCHLHQADQPCPNSRRRPQNPCSNRHCKFLEHCRLFAWASSIVCQRKHCVSSIVSTHSRWPLFQQYSCAQEISDLVCWTAFPVR